jgi:PKD repeat protein
MKLVQTIVSISIILVSINAVSALANDNTNMYTNKPVAASEFKAAFTATPDPNKPLTVRFTDESIGKPVPYKWGKKYGVMTYFWGFGDKTTSILKNPVHTFKEAGKYNVYLRIQNAEGQVSKTVMVIDVK